MKKVLISTYCHWFSYGSVLQSFGLQQMIKSLGAKPRTVIFSNETATPAVGKLKIKPSLAAVRALVQRLNRAKLETGRTRSIDFIAKNIDAANISSPENITFEAPEADVYIAGSDQIWRPSLKRDDYFLNYAPKDKRRISYAASMGVDAALPTEAGRFTKLLRNIDRVSVREESMIAEIGKYTDRPILQHIDPTFLVSAAKWREYESEYDIKEPYILVYALYWDTSLNRQLKRLHKKTGYKIVSIQNTLRPIYANKIVMDAGPAEFLWLVDHAQAVVTSSFHGTAFSVIFNKRFYAVVNPESPARIHSLLKALGVGFAPDIASVTEYAADYTVADSNIEKEAKRSADYLRRAIFDEE